MPDKSFSSRVGDLKRKADFIQARRPDLKRLNALNPADLVEEVNRLVALDADQESLKGRKIEQTAGARLAMRQALAAASALVDELRAAIKRSGRVVLLKTLPRLSAARSFEGQIGQIKALLAFVRENPETAGRVEKSDLETIRKGLEAAASARATSDATRGALPATTRKLDQEKRQALIHASAWLDIYQGLFTLLGDEKALAQIRSLRRVEGRKPAATRATSPSAGA